MSYEYSCEECKGNPKNVARAVIQCPGCGKKVHLCRSCRDTYVACSDDCREKWRKEAAAGLPKEPLLAPMGAKAKKPKGYGVYQKELGS